MQIGLGVLGLPPAHFWTMTLPEFNAAVAGWQEKNGTKPTDDGMTHSRLSELMEQYPD